MGRADKLTEACSIAFSIRGNAQPWYRDPNVRFPLTDSLSSMWATRNQIPDPVRLAAICGAPVVVVPIGQTTHRSLVTHEEMQVPVSICMLTSSGHG